MITTVFQREADIQLKRHFGDNLINDEIRIIRSKMIWIESDGWNLKKIVR